jgi:hypothetical protein
MRKTVMLALSVWLVLLFFGTPAFAQLRLDVDIEGPWILYLDPGFKNQAGTATTVLVAIAPQVVGHNYPIFSAGTGGVVSHLGIYCVGFDGGCTPNNLAALSWDSYAKPAPELIAKPGSWDWTTLSSSAYVFILPVPNSYSSDGLYGITIQSTFPKIGTPATTTESGLRSIGIKLHYDKGPTKLSLFGCVGTPSVQNCGIPKGLDQDNSGTLRMQIRSMENPTATPDCDYHAHRAYHKMLMLVDPQLTVNDQKAYINVPTYDSCSQCDPQQDLIPSDCSSMGMPLNVTYAPTMLDVPAALDLLVAFLGGPDFDPKQGGQVWLPQLADQAEGLRGKFPAEGQLVALKEILQNSEAGIAGLLDLKSAAGVTRSNEIARALPENRRVALKTAALQEQSLSQMADLSMLLAHSGKDCRAVVMLVQ